ncbi:MAG: hypothetical protein Q6K26_00955 [Gloeomargarita sp. SZTDM-1c_bins_89]
MSQKRARLNLWGTVVLLLVGLTGGLALTLWGMNTFSPQKTVRQPIDRRSSQREREPGRGVQSEFVLSCWAVAIGT